jgi:hypothetical protein
MKAYHGPSARARQCGPLFPPAKAMAWIPPPIYNIKLRAEATHPISTSIEIQIIRMTIVNLI